MRQRKETELEQEIERQRLGDELRAIMSANVAQFSNETYEENLRRRANLALREREILRKLYG